MMSVCFMEAPRPMVATPAQNVGTLQKRLSVLRGFRAVATAAIPATVPKYVASGVGWSGGA